MKRASLARGPVQVAIGVIIEAGAEKVSQETNATRMTRARTELSVAL